MAAFATPFTGVPVRNAVANTCATRCEMGDSVAPKISLKDTKFDGTSSVTVEWQVIPPNVAAAQSVEANSALSVSLRSRVNAARALPAKPGPPPGVSPVDHYFPTATRNQAPVVSLVYDESVSVAYETINPAVAGVAANSTESIAFWKAKQYRWAAPDVESGPPQETVSTKLFEKHFPSNVRNRAPYIRMKKPAGDWDSSAFLELGSEFVQLSTDLARELSIQVDDTDPTTAGSAAVARYFGEDRLHKAPDILIKQDEKVEITLVDIAEPTSLARVLLSGASE